MPRQQKLSKCVETDELAAMIGSRACVVEKSPPLFRLFGPYVEDKAKGSFKCCFLSMLFERHGPSMWQ